MIPIKTIGEIFRLAADTDLSCSQIADKVGLHYATIARLLRKYGRRALRRDRKKASETLRLTQAIQRIREDSTYIAVALKCTEIAIPEPAGVETT